jgi:hypothetical protein
MWWCFIDPEDAGYDYVHRNVIGVFEHNKTKYLRMVLPTEGEPMCNQ